MTTTVTITMPEELATALRQAAALNDRSLSAEIRTAAREHLTPAPEEA